MVHGKSGKLPNTKSNSDPYAPHSNPNSGYNKKRDLTPLLVGGGKQPPKPPTSL